MLRLLVISAVSAVLKSNFTTVSAMTAKSVDFEVYGRVQGVFFRRWLSFAYKSKEIIKFSKITGCNKSVARNTARRTMPLQSMDFEVFGTVQGVYFRKYTKEQAEKLGLRGWCKNTPQGTVLGHMQGPTDKVETMMQWLKSTGSPTSKIEKCEFRNPTDIEDYTFVDFNIRKD